MLRARWTGLGEVRPRTEEDVPLIVFDKKEDWGAENIAELGADQYLRLYEAFLQAESGYGNVPTQYMLDKTEFYTLAVRTDRPKHNAHVVNTCERDHELAHLCQRSLSGDLKRDSHPLIENKAGLCCSVVPLKAGRTAFVFRATDRISQFVHYARYAGSVTDLNLWKELGVPSMALARMAGIGETKEMFASLSVRTDVQIDVCAVVSEMVQIGCCEHPESWFAQVMQEVRKVRSSDTCQGIVFTGMSLGGALAELLMGCFALDDPLFTDNTRCVTFGGFRVFKQADWVTKIRHDMKERIRHHINVGDMVPWLGTRQAHGFVRMGTCFVHWPETICARDVLAPKAKEDSFLSAIAGHSTYLGVSFFFASLHSILAGQIVDDKECALSHERKAREPQKSALATTAMSLFKSEVLEHLPFGIDADWLMGFCASVGNMAMFKAWAPS